MRFKLVPKKIKEEDFWRNYFYRVSLIKQSVALHSMSHDDDDSATTGAGADKTVTDDGSKVAEISENQEGIQNGEEEDIPEWEKELQRELQEYEVNYPRVYIVTQFLIFFPPCSGRRASSLG